MRYDISDCRSRVITRNEQHERSPRMVNVKTWAFFHVSSFNGWTMFSRSAANDFWNKAVTFSLSQKGISAAKSWNNSKPTGTTKQRSAKQIGTVLWKSVIKMLSSKKTLFLIFARILYSLCRTIQSVSWPLMSSLMSTEPPKINLLYACAVAMGVNDLIGCLTMHHLDYKCDLLENRLKVTVRPFCFLSTLL